MLGNGGVSTSITTCHGVRQSSDARRTNPFKERSGQTTREVGVKVNFKLEDHGQSLPVVVPRPPNVAVLSCEVRAKRGFRRLQHEVRRWRPFTRMRIRGVVGPCGSVKVEVRTDLGRRRCTRRHRCRRGASVQKISPGRGSPCLANNVLARRASVCKPQAWRAPSTVTRIRSQSGNPRQLRSSQGARNIRRFLRFAVSPPKAVVPPSPALFRSHRPTKQVGGRTIRFPATRATLHQEWLRLRTGENGRPGAIDARGSNRRTGIIK